MRISALKDSDYVNGGDVALKVILKLKMAQSGISKQLLNGSLLVNS